MGAILLPCTFDASSGPELGRLHAVRVRLVAQDRAAEVIGPPEGLLEEAGRRALASDQPLSFLNATPEAQAGEEGAGLRRAAAAYLEDRIDEGAFGPVRDGIFLYRISVGGHEQTAVVADIHVDDYPGFVRPHERTLAEREEDLIAYLSEVGMTANPVTIAHRASMAVRSALALVTERPPELDLEVDGERHTVWEVPTELLAEVSAAFDQVDVTYVLDGHHRMAAARRHAHAVGATRADPAGRVLVAAIPDDELVVYPFHRWVDACWPDDGGAWHQGPPAGPDPTAAVVVTRAGWRRLPLEPREGELDVEALERTVLGPIFGIHDARTDPRLEAIPGAEATSAVCDRVELLGGTGILLHPPTPADLFAVADRGGVVPPKSTFFAPKPRSGIFLTDRRHPPAAYSRLQD